MSPALTLPDDLRPDEWAVVRAFRRPAEERAALAIRVRREHARLTEREGMTYHGALDVIGDPGSAFPVSRETARRIVQGRGPWTVP